jgi:asparagine synthase (glutamine-hydrolysing)
MAGTLAHRGPDHQGEWATEDGRVGLAHRRLSIIDLSPAGCQPMRSPSGRFQIVFNGEIYNYLELRDELRSAGRAFSTNSDTEVLLAAFEHWGVTATLRKVSGMFAFALWDVAERRLLLARDRAGKKPLYIADRGDRVFFASEMKALLAVGVPDDVDHEALHHYLSLAYVPRPRTIYSAIREVPPGSVMVIDEKLHATVESYWRLPAPASGGVPFDEAVEETERRLREAVRIRLRADVPVGIFLSGGIDSGLLVALASQEASQPLRTFTVRFGEQRFDESAKARLVAERYGTEHTIITTETAAESLISRVAAAYDEPFGDPSAVPTYAVAEAASKHLRVVLNGEGADELFAGYRRAWAARLMSSVGFVPRGLARGVHAVMPAPRRFRTPYAFAHRFIGGLHAGLGERYIIWSSDGFSETEKRRLYREPFAVEPTSETLGDNLIEGSELSRFMAMDFIVGMADCLLVKMDIATMAHSLEARCPFLDHHVVEWAASLPRDVVFQGRNTKPILRALAAKYLPQEIVTGPKHGFEIPLADWIDGPLSSLVRDSLMSRNGMIADLFDRSTIEALVDGRETADRERRAKHIWILMMLAQWDEHRRTATGHPALLERSAGD